MAQEIKQSLGIKKHLVCNSKRLKNNPLQEKFDMLISEESSTAEIQNFIKKCYSAYLP